MDDKFFVLWDGRWVRRMDHDMKKGDLLQVHLAAVAEQVRQEVINGLDPRGEILMTGPIHLTHEWTSPLAHPGRTRQELIDGHARHASMSVTRQDRDRSRLGVAFREFLTSTWGATHGDPQG
jgi:hypothetical protein